ncbi:MAG: M28 family peptidase [Anaerolineaceae bacterium]|nr:M28 family peptidase [Anaerolineaceae bacterium]
MKDKPFAATPYLIIAATVLVMVVVQLILTLALRPEPGFNGEQAYKDIEYLVRFGPRVPGSGAHTQTARWINRELHRSGWDIELQRDVVDGKTIHNVIAKRGTGKPWIILGTHYDTRQWADRDLDPDSTSKPVIGANDGASGVAVLVELGRTLPHDLSKQIWLVFFDAEDQGEIPTWDWIMGSQYFVDNLVETPDSVIIIDMIGDTDLQIYQERNSDPALTQEIWETAAKLGFASSFIPEYRHKMLDDHTPFIEKGIPTALIIDFDYPYWHSTQDTIDKVSEKSLQTVGDTLYAWLVGE